MADQVARQDASYATYFSFDRLLSGIGQAVADGEDEAHLSDILFEELPDLTVGRPFAPTFAVGRDWGRVVGLADVDAIYDQPDGPGALLHGEFDTATLSDRIEQLPDGEVSVDRDSNSWTVLRYSADPLADGGDFGLGRDGSLAVSGDRMIVAGSTIDPDVVTRSQSSSSALVDAGVDAVVSRLDDVDAYAAAVFYRNGRLDDERNGDAVLRSSWAAAGFASAFADDGTEHAHTVLWHQNTSDALDNAAAVESLMAEYAQCQDGITVDVDERLLTAHCRVDRPGGWASDILDDAAPPSVVFTE